ncbi:MAG: 3-ketoacyl-ACP reductase [Cyclobacteriaceae bacterium]|nr:MAG: 3-ketoacyl-ACP reductase [Cyclobacteriaceae bacterium]
MNRTALVTGGTRGIGLGVAIQLAKQGFDLILNGVRDETQVAGVLEQLQNEGGKVYYCQADISTAEGRSKALSFMLENFDRLNLLVNNAGVAPRQRYDLLEMSEESYDRVMTINLKGPFFLTKMVAGHMVQWKGLDNDYKGCIVNIGSVSASMVSTQRGQYCISKAGIGMMTQLFAVRLGESGIPVFEVRPGVIETDMTAAVMEKYQGLRDQGLFVEPRLGVPEDVGNVVAALATGAFPYSTGNVISVDGGLTIPRL